MFLRRAGAAVALTVCLCCSSSASTANTIAGGEEFIFLRPLTGEEFALLALESFGANGRAELSDLIDRFPIDGDIDALAVDNVRAVVSKQGVLTTTEAVETLNSLAYLLNNRRVGLMLWGRFEFRGGNVVFHPDRLPMPAIEGLLAERLSRGREEVDRYVNVWMREKFGITLEGFRSMFRDVLTAEHERTLALAFKVQEMADNGTKTLVSAMIEGIFRAFDQSGSDVSDEAFRGVFEANFMFMRNTFDQMTCGDFMESLMRPVRH